MEDVVIDRVCLRWIAFATLMELFRSGPGEIRRRRKRRPVGQAGRADYLPALGVNSKAESLEDRTLLAAVSDHADALKIELGANEQLSVYAHSSGYAFNSTSGFANAGIAAPGTFSSFGQSNLILSDFEQYSSIEVVDVAAGASVVFNDSGVHPYRDQFFITLDDGAAVPAIVMNGSSEFAPDEFSKGTHSLFVDVDSNIAFTSRSRLTTTDGDLELIANQNETSSGTFIGILLNNAAIQTKGTGHISLNGVGSGTSDTAEQSDGVRMTNGARLRSTSNAAVAGTISVNGIGGTGTLGSSGIVLSGSTTIVASVTGAITVSGQGGHGDGAQHGVSLEAGATVEVTDAALTLVGTALSGHSAGVRLSEGDSGHLRSLNTGSIHITAEGHGEHADLLAGSNSVIGGSMASGDIAVSVDSIDFRGALNVQSSGVFSVAPRSAGGAVIVGNESRHSLSLSTEELSHVHDGFERIEIGDAGSTGSVYLDSFTLQDPVSIAGDVIVASGATIHGGDNALTLNASRYIKLDSGALLTTQDGGITMSGNETGLSIGSFSGIVADNAHIRSDGDGNITLAGKGGIDKVFDWERSHSRHGVSLGNGTTVVSTAAGLSAGRITIEGTGGNHRYGNYGVSLGGSGTALISVDGDISISGTGGRNGHANYGVALHAIEEISSTGVGPYAAAITINGKGGSGTTSNDGVLISSASAEITSADGPILIRGKGGDGDGLRTQHYGVFVQSIRSIASTGTGMYAATITIDGTGGDGTSENHGVQLSGSTTKLASIDGAISIIGGGNGSANGVNVNGVVALESTGTGPDAATILIDGTAGDGPWGGNVGISFWDSAPLDIATIDGAISILGRGGSGPCQSLAGCSDNGGVWGSANFISTGEGNDAASITIIGSGGTGSANDPEDILTGAHHGIVLGGSIRSIDGPVSIIGQGGSGRSGGNVGLLAGGLEISVAGTGANAAPVIISGIGGGGAGGRNAGLSMWNSTLEVIGRPLQIGGHAGTGDSLGVGLFGASTTELGTKILSPGDAEIVITADGNGRETDFEAYAETVIGGPAATGNITINADSMELAGTELTLQSKGDLRLLPRTPTTTIGLGGGSGELNLSDTELMLLQDGFSSITIGDPVNGTGEVHIETANFRDPVTIAGGEISDESGIDITAPTARILGNVSLKNTSSGPLIVDGDLLLDSASKFTVEINSDAETVVNSQLQVVGTGRQIELGNAVLDLGFSGGPLAGDVFRIIDLVDEASLISGTFALLPEGATFLVDDAWFRITYAGGTGNDVVLSVLNPADLVGAEFDAESDHVIQGRTEVTFTIHNIGDVDATAFHSQIVWSANAILGDSDDIVVPGSTMLFAGLAADALVSRTLNVELDRSVLYTHALASNPAGQAVGSVSEEVSHLFLVIDVGDEIAEVDETNNLGTSEFVDSDRITYFPWDSNSSGIVTPIEALRAVQAIGTAAAAQDFDGNGIVTTLEALAVFQRIGYVRNESALADTRILPFNDKAERAGAMITVSAAEVCDEDERLRVDNNRERQLRIAHLSEEPFEFDLQFENATDWLDVI